MADIPNRDELERKIARLLGRFNKRQLGELLEMMGNSPSMAKVPPSYWTDSERALAAELIPFSEDVYLQAAGRVLDSVPVGVDWTLVNQAAADYSIREVGKLVTQINDTTRKRIGGAVSNYFTEAQTLGDLELALSRMKNRFGEILGPRRAELIAVTEVTRAAAEGERATVRELKREGIEMVEVWQTNNDEIVCAICGPRHGKKEGDGWTRAEGPPAHPRCRCWVNHELPGVGAEQAESIAPSFAVEQTGFDEMMKEYDGWAKSLTEKELSIEGIDGYQGSGYRYVNPYLRGQPLGPRTSEELLDAFINKYKTIDKLDSALNKASLPKNISVYRGAVSSSVNKFNVGDILNDKGFLSTSLDKDFAIKMGRSMSEQINKNFYLLEINAPKGTKAGFLDAAFGYKAEQEVLFARGQRMLILDIIQEGDYTRVIAEILP